MRFTGRAHPDLHKVGLGTFTLEMKYMFGPKGQEPKNGADGFGALLVVGRVPTPRRGTGARCIRLHRDHVRAM